MRLNSLLVLRVLRVLRVIITRTLRTFNAGRLLFTFFLYRVTVLACLTYPLSSLNLIPYMLCVSHALM